MRTILYFAYGSNMSTPRLRARVPSARPLAVAQLPAHRLMFHKKGSDDSAKCDAAWTNDQGDAVCGTVFEIAASEKPELDRHEGLRNGYEDKPVSVFTADGWTLDAYAYYATHIDAALKPYEWYKEHVVRGALEHGLPMAYSRIISAVEAIPDPDLSRHRRELSIYR